ncbi:MAG: hypothetical protein H6696_11675 [Deferribacteres bacterium]|nr:hypothetical protein [Deferribacteres bacterium]
MDVNTTAILTIISGVVGFSIREMIIVFTGTKKEQKRLAVNARLGKIEKQLSEFYWPIYIRLQKDNALWRLILFKNDEKGSLRQRIGEEIEKKFILPNHEQILQIIENGMHLMSPNKKLEKLIVKYIRHVAIFQALRMAGEDSILPDEIDEKWPQELFDTIADETFKLQGEYDNLIGLKVILRTK